MYATRILENANGSRCGKKRLLPSLTELEITCKIEQIKSKFAIKCVEDPPR